MSPEQTIWMLSMIGAMLFVAVGFLGARATHLRAAPAPIREVRVAPAGEGVELERAKGELRRIRQASDAALEEARALDQQLREVIEDRERMRGQLIDLEADLVESVRVATELRAQRDAAGASRDRELAALQRRLEERVERLQEEASALRQEKAALALALEDAERRAEATASAQEMDRKVTELSMELAAARSRLGDLERLREENTRLRAAAADHAVLRADVKRLELEHTRLKALAFAQPQETARELHLLRRRRARSRRSCTRSLEA